MSRSMTKPTKWPVRAAKTRPFRSESSLSAWWKLGSLFLLSAQRRLWSDCADAQADLRLRWAHMPFVGFVLCRAAAQMTFCVSTDTSPLPPQTIANADRVRFTWHCERLGRRSHCKIVHVVFPSFSPNKWLWIPHWRLSVRKTGYDFRRPTPTPAKLSTGKFTI